ncbi:hypothetical protein CVD28_04465 [Bacillus sp. M6-12]|uniref:hypothetical protein n=1 Tax=Bacillus sp. M6-12 TaxID=2054166 RepID=UPI000C771FDA|nr:hypothetical protein [Bacillus sp. M6-12]PLS19674.1 hypothetical protein CVD28_04465 [Bacillus sp. M6-12]
MTATMTKKISMGIVVAFLISIFFMFASPIQSYAASASKGNDIGGVKVNVTSKGQLTISGNDNFTTGSSAGAWGKLFEKYKGFIVGISGIGAISMIAFFVIQFMKLGASAGNPQARSQALAGVLWTGLAAAGLGAVTIITGFFYNSIG